LSFIEKPGKNNQQCTSEQLPPEKERERKEKIEKNKRKITGPKKKLIREKKMRINRPLWISNTDDEEIEERLSVTN
jgi:hypothetical protein